MSRTIQNILPLSRSLSPSSLNFSALTKAKQSATPQWNRFTSNPGEAYDQIKEMCIFLLNNFTLPVDKALAVYVQSPGSPFVYCGAVTIARPSAVLSLLWPEPGSQGPFLTADASPLSSKIGVSVQDLSSLPSLDIAADKKIEHTALKVGENLFNFMQSFCGVDGSKLIVPMDILDRWFKKFQERAKRDPGYLKGFTL